MLAAEHKRAALHYKVIFWTNAVAEEVRTCLKEFPKNAADDTRTQLRFSSNSSCITTSNPPQYRRRVNVQLVYPILHKEYHLPLKRLYSIICWANIFHVK